MTDTNTRANIMTEFKHTQGDWTQHVYSNPKVRSVVSGDSAFSVADIVIGSGDKIIGEVRFQTISGGYPVVDSVAEFHANAALFLAAPKLLAAVMAVIYATSDYLPPDGITAQDCLNRVIGATDNADIFAILQSLRGHTLAAQS